MEEGSITGQVVNLSQDGQPAAGIEVILRAELEGELGPVAAAKTNSDGRFTFHGVPLERELTYVPGANLGGIHYPGPRLQLGPRRPSATVQLAVRETVAQPSPLVIRQHEVVIQSEAGALHVTEALLVDNPSSRTYVGNHDSQQQTATTFTLGIPTDFERLTFQQEFFGRGFALQGGRLVTSVPWEPGQRWLRYTYTLRNDQPYRCWRRTIDAPCQQLRVRVQDVARTDVRSNLPLTEPDQLDGNQDPSFATRGTTLQPGYVVEVELGRLPIRWTAHARWYALLLLVTSVIGTIVWLRRRPATADRATRGSSSPLAGPHFKPKDQPIGPTTDAAERGEATGHKGLPSSQRHVS
jgi:hypothetical protein